MWLWPWHTLTHTLLLPLCVLLDFPTSSLTAWKPTSLRREHRYTNHLSAKSIITGKPFCLSLKGVPFSKDLAKSGVPCSLAWNKMPKLTPLKSHRSIVCPHSQQSSIISQVISTSHLIQWGGVSQYRIRRSSRYSHSCLKSKDVCQLKYMWFSDKTSIP